VSTSRIVLIIGMARQREWLFLFLCDADISRDHWVEKRKSRLASRPRGCSPPAALHYRSAIEERGAVNHATGLRLRPDGCPASIGLAAMCIGARGPGESSSLIDGASVIPGRIAWLNRFVAGSGLSSAGCAAVLVA
jgi:hypothetical protein